MTPTPEPNESAQEPNKPQTEPEPRPGEEPEPPRQDLLRPRAYLAKKKTDSEQGDSEAEDEEWPFGRLVADAPIEARLVQGIVWRINYHCCRRNETPYVVARSAKIGLETLYKILRGESYPSLVTIARLEKHFGRRLWGNEHLPRGRKTPPKAPPCACKP